MANSVSITHNLLRLLAKSFMYIHRPNEFVMMPGAKYVCSTPDDGQIGIVEVTHLFDVQLHNLRPAVMLNADGDLLAIERFKAAGAFSADTFQVCTLHFVRRSDNAFKAILDRELPRAGITITRQKSLL